MVSARAAFALRLARAGEKDHAREWLNFIEQAQLPKIISSHGYCVKDLCADLVLLRDLVHPQTALERCSVNDMAAIMEELKSLRELVNAPKITISSSGPPPVLETNNQAENKQK